MRHTQQMTFQNSYNSARSQYSNQSNLDANNKTQNLTTRSIIEDKQGAVIPSDNQQGGMKLTRGVFDVNCSTTKEPTTVLADMYKVLE
jgi:hypothetical protein